MPELTAKARAALRPDAAEIILPATQRSPWPELQGTHYYSSSHTPATYSTASTIAPQITNVTMSGGNG